MTSLDHRTPFRGPIPLMPPPGALEPRSSERGSLLGLAEGLGASQLVTAPCTYRLSHTEAILLKSSI